MQAKVTVAIDVSAIEDDAVLTDKARVLRSVCEAIRHAVKYGEGEGFCHEMENDLSLEIRNVEVEEVTS